MSLAQYQLKVSKMISRKPFFFVKFGYVRNLHGYTPEINIDDIDIPKRTDFRITFFRGPLSSVSV